ncbi:acetoin reductase family protein [Gloeopeniophorella convolvens]|nr:acetoin reductase family protein [Gloeopeniophorella convolvens]
MTTTNKVALVTGAARGIGRGIALRLSEDGFAVAVNDLPNTPELDELVQEIEGQGRRAFAVPADVSVEKQVEQMIQKVVQELGSLDVMVANAGIFIFDSVLSATAEDFDRLMSVNARSTLLCYKYAGKQMVAQGRGGRIIGSDSLVVSLASQVVASYSATKFAIRGLTQAAAQELGAHGITVNAYAPGTIDTRMRRWRPFTTTDTAHSANQFHIENTPIKRLGTPDDIAGLVSYLASDKSSFVTGK